MYDSFKGLKSKAVFVEFLMFAFVYPSANLSIKNMKSMFYQLEILMRGFSWTMKPILK